MLDEKDKYGRLRSYIRGHNSLGRSLSEATKQKMSIERMGSLNPAFGMPKSKKQLETTAKIWKGKHLSKEIKEKMSIAKIGKICSEEHRRNMVKAFTGRKLKDSTRKKMSISRMGAKSTFWKGGLTEKAKLIRSSAEYKQWRTSVFLRDEYKCIQCGTGGRIEADHIKPFSLFPELVFDISNGRTLCKPCHKETPTYGRKIENFRKQNCLHVDCY